MIHTINFSHIFVKSCHQIQLAPIFHLLKLSIYLFIGKNVVVSCNIVLNVNLGISRIRELKSTHVQLSSILNFMCDAIKHLNHQEMRDGLVYEAVYSAVQNGTVEIIKILCEARPELLFRGLEDGKNIFHYAVECRQENVYSLIYGVRKRNLITTLRDNSDNSILHYAGMLSPLAQKKLDGIAGAALQMQRERQWYKVRIIFYYSCTLNYIYDP